MIIEHYKSINKGAVLGSFNIKVEKWGNFIIRDCTHFNKNGAEWISFPSKQYKTESGETKYFSYCLFEDKDVSQKFQNLVMLSLKSYLEKNHPQSKPKSNDYEQVPF